MDDASPLAALALARIEKGILDFTTEQRQIQRSITQLRREVTDAIALASHEIRPQSLSNAGHVSPWKHHESSALVNLSESRPKSCHHIIMSHETDKKHGDRQFGVGELEPPMQTCYASPEAVDGEADEQNEYTAQHDDHDTGVRTLGDSDDLDQELHKQRTSSLDPNWPATISLRTTWESLALENDDDLHLKLTSQSLGGLSRSRSLEFAHPEHNPWKAGAEQIQTAKAWVQTTILLPGSLQRSMLDLIGMVLLIWDIIFTPLQIAWSLNIEGWLLGMTLCVSSYWTLDIFISSRTAYYCETGDLETRPLHVLLHYLRQHFLFDLAVVVADWVSLIVRSFPGAVSLARLTKVTRLVRLIRVARLTRLTELEEVLNSYGIGRPLIESVKIALFTAIFTHGFACLWFMVGNLHTSDTGYNWVAATWAESSQTFLDTPTSFQYSSALQWTLSTMISGTSSIVSLNTTEHVVTCCVILTGLLFQAFVVSILSAVAVESKERQRSLAVTLSSLDKFCKEHKVSRQVALRARSQARAAANRKANASLPVKEVDGLQKLASKVRTQILREVYEPHLSCHELFYLLSQIDKTTCSKLVNDAMNLMYVNAGIDIFLAEEAATGAYLLSRGRAIYVQDPQVCKVIKSTTVDVVLDTWLAEAAIWTDWFHVGTLEAACDECEICCLNFEGFLLAVQSSMIVMHVIGQFAKEYRQRLAKAGPPSSSWPSDLGTFGVDFMQILPSLPEPVRRSFAFMSLDCTVKRGLIEDAQIHLLENEVNEGKSNLVLVKVATHPSLQRLVSVVRISVKRDDGSVFAQLGKFERERFAPKCELPGSKVKDHEPMETTAGRIAEQLQQHIGAFDFEECGLIEEFGTSHKTRIPTYYSITTFSYYSSKGVNSSSQDVPDSPRSVKRSRFESISLVGRRHSFGFLTKRKSAVALERRLRSGRELFTIEYNGNAYLCMWLHESDIEFLKSEHGVAILQSLSDEGYLQRRQTRPESDGGSGSSIGSPSVGDDVDDVVTTIDLGVDGDFAVHEDAHINTIVV